MTLAASKMERGLIFVSLILCALAVFHTEALIVASSDNQQVLRFGEAPLKSNSAATGCACVSKTCGCCMDMSIPQLKFKDLTCSNFTYLPDEYGLRVTLTMNSFTMINETVSGKNPPPLCFGIPHLEALASVCLDFYSLDITDKDFSGCAKLQIRFIEVIHLNENFGCFNLPLLGKEESARAGSMVKGIEKSRQLAKSQ